METHTPGPWLCESLNPKTLEIEVWAADRAGSGSAYGCLVARVPAKSVYEETWANARLIALAPELAEFVRDTLDRLETMTSADFSRGSDKPIRDRAQALLTRIARLGGPETTTEE